MSRKKLILDLEEEVNETRLFGLNSSSTHLDLVHALNKSPLFHFNRKDDLEIVEKDIKNYFIAFESKNVADENHCLLVKTKGLNGYLSNELKIFDYIFAFTCSTESFQEELFKFLFNHKHIQLIRVLDIDELKEKVKNLLTIESE